LFLRSGSPQNIYLLPQHPNFHLKRCPRPKQICDRTNNEPDKISHPARASPDSRSTASEIEFAIGTASVASRARVAAWQSGDHFAGCRYRPHLNRAVDVINPSWCVYSTYRKRADSQYLPTTGGSDGKSFTRYASVSASARSLCYFIIQCRAALICECVAGIGINLDACVLAPGGGYPNRLDRRRRDVTIQATIMQQEGQETSSIIRMWVAC
jgi:hypothetical protein